MQQVHRCELSFGEKIVKIGPVDPEIIWLKLIKKKLTQAKYTSLPASLLSRLKKSCLIVMQIYAQYSCFTVRWLLV